MKDKTYKMTLNYFHEHSIADAYQVPSLISHKMAYFLLTSLLPTSFSSSYPRNDHSSAGHDDSGKATVAGWIVIVSEIDHLSVVDYLHKLWLPSLYF